MIRVGPAGWSYADWEGKVYPRPKPAGFHPLDYLARYVNCIELNSSFYAYPRDDHARSWMRLIDDVPEFRFVVKLHRDFTHGPFNLDSAEFERKARTFLDGIEPIRGAQRLSALLVQFPVTFVREIQSRKHLDRLCGLFAHIPLVFELRHRSWFDSDVLSKFAARELGVAHLDLPAARDHPPADFPTGGGVGYLRLHGRNARHWFQAGSTRDQRYDYLYGAEELEPLVERARRLANDHDEVFVVTNNHFGGQAMVNAIEIMSLLRGGAVAAPPQLVRSFPHLEPIALPEGDQGTLF